MNPSFPRTFGVVLATLFLVVCHPSEARTFTDVKGRTIEAELVSATGDVVTILVNGREIPSKISMFSEPDQQFIRTWIKNNPGKQKFDLGWFVDHKESGNKKRAKVDYDERLDSLLSIMRVSIHNPSPGDLEDVTIHCDAIVHDKVDTRNNAYRRLNSSSFVKSRTQRNRGTINNAKIPANTRLDIEVPFKMEFYVDRDYGRVDASVKDKLLGYWVRIYKKGSLVDEYRRDLDDSIKHLKWNGGETTKVEASSKFRKMN